MSYNFDVTPERFIRIGQAMGLELAGKTTKEKRTAIFNEVRRLKVASGISATLRDRGAKRSDVSELSRKAMNDLCLATNPRRPNQRDIECLFEEAL
jgi:alcohol dehydrogenase class IV